MSEEYDRTTGEIIDPSKPDEAPASTPIEEVKPNSHLRHWNALRTPDKEATKSFDRGRFKGTAINPSYQEMRMTEHFGPCGVGWGIEKPEFTLVPAGEELLVFCTVGVWYADRQRNVSSRQVYGVGGDKVIRLEKAGRYTSDEAYKAAYTDAVGNAFKRIGMAADIHMGLWDDNKYARPEQTQTTTPPQAPATPARRSAAPARRQAGNAAKFAGPFSSGHVPEPSLEPEQLGELIADGYAVAGKGVSALHAFCELLSNGQKRRIGRKTYDEWMKKAEAKDREHAQ